MQIKELIKNVSNLIESREIISHGSIRCLHSDQAVSEIEEAEPCDEVGTDIIGDDDLASELSDLSEDGDRIADLDFNDIKSLEDVYRGSDLEDYIQRDEEDELDLLEQLIDAAQTLVATAK